MIKKSAYTLFALLVVVIVPAMVYLWPVQQQEAAVLPQAGPAPAADVRQQLGQLTDCAALLAVYEGHVHGGLNENSEVFNLISYGLGKAQELALQAGLDSDAAKGLYDEKTLAQFMQYSAGKEQYVLDNQAVADRCKKDLLQYEPGAQVQATINKARAMAQDMPAPAQP